MFIKDFHIHQAIPYPLLVPFPSCSSILII